ncbi:MAG: hypothetical protein ABFE07_29000 [Armatimonadia bacterium]
MDALGVEGWNMSRFNWQRILHGRSVNPSGARALGRLALLAWAAVAMLVAGLWLYRTEYGAELRGYAWGLVADLADRVGGINRPAQPIQVTNPENQIEISTPVRVNVDNTQEAPEALSAPHIEVHTSE